MAKTSAKENFTTDDARDILGLDHEAWILQLNDEQLRMLKEIMAAEETRRKEIFGGLRDKIDELG